MKSSVTWCRCVHTAVWTQSSGRGRYSWVTWRSPAVSHLPSSSSWRGGAGTHEHPVRNQKFSWHVFNPQQAHKPRDKDSSAVPAQWYARTPRWTLPDCSWWTKGAGACLCRSPHPAGIYIAPPSTWRTASEKNQVHLVYLLYLILYSGAFTLSVNRPSCTVVCEGYGSGSPLVWGLRVWFSSSVRAKGLVLLWCEG